jgi:hypothetical protein
MIEQFDIFHRDSDLDMPWKWVQVANTIEDAKVQVRELSVIKPGEYLILDRGRRIKTFIHTRAEAYRVSSLGY